MVEGVGVVEQKPPFPGYGLLGPTCYSRFVHQLYFLAPSGPVALTVPTSIWRDRFGNLVL